MSTKDFGSELTNLGLPPAMDARTLTEKAMLKNRRRIRSLAALTIGLWLIDFWLVPAVWMPLAAKLKHDAMTLSASTDLPTLVKTMQDITMHIAIISGVILGIMTVVALLAAISTVWLVLTARRVTLEQVSAGLAQISEQLKRLEPRERGA